MTHKPEPLLWLNDARGQYIPRDFANCFIDRDKHVSGVRAELWAVLEGGPDGPEGPDYWEVWQDVCDNATVTDNDGVKYSLHQDGDLWLIPEGMQWSDANEFFVWPNESDPEDEYEHEDKLDDEPLDLPGWEGGFADNH